MAFQTYSSKSTALRGLTRHLGNAAEGRDLSAMLSLVDGKWGFDPESADKAVFGEDVTEGDEDLILYCGHSNCPACGVHLSNGVMDFDSLADRAGSEKEAYKLQQHAFACMACDHEWGADIVLKGAKTRGEPTRVYTNKSAIDNAVQSCHTLYSALPTETRRKDAIQAAVDLGVAFYTARTQYQKWFKANKSAKAR